ncbi:MAG: glycine/sarcosine/betaine reductase selenoprotein B family protein [Alphaproteobacteria bacterium]
MVRIADLPQVQQVSLPNMECPEFENTPCVAGPPLAQRRVAVVSSAGLTPRGQMPFVANDGGFREIAHDLPDADLLMTHLSVNFDRSGFARDLDLVLPRRRLDELAAAGVIAEVGPRHFSFMGATPPDQMAAAAAEVAGALRADGVDSAILLPV